MHATLETERLLLPPWSADHVALVSRLSADPRVMRYVGLGTPWPAAKAIEVSDRQVAHWHQHGFGWRAILEKASGEQIGLASLNLMGDGAAGVDPDEHEIGWWLAPAVWGRGYASEAGRAVAADALSTRSIPRLTARILPANAASIRVARSLGMAHVFDTTGRFNERVSIYRLAAPANDQPPPTRASADGGWTEQKPAATYSPRPFQAKYHRR